MAISAFTLPAPTCNVNQWAPIWANFLGNAANPVGISQILNTLITAVNAINGQLLEVVPYVVQPEAATGFSVTVPNGVSIFYLAPAGTFATGTITMPSAPVDGMVLRFGTSNTITTLTLSPNAGQTIQGAPTTFSINTAFAFFWNAANTQWKRVG